VAGSRQVTRLEAESYVPDWFRYCPPSAAKPVIESKQKLRLGPADLHLLVGSWRLRGIAYIYVWLKSSYEPPECRLGQLAYAFLIRILSMSLTSVSIFFVCYYSSVSISVFWGILFTLFQPCRQVPLKKGNSQMDSSVQNNPATPNQHQIFLQLTKWKSFNCATLALETTL
jgi:hypothetical protein